MNSVGLKPRVMWHLAHEQPLTINELTARIDGNRDSVSAAARALWRAGFLIRREHPDKGKGYTKPYQYAIRVPEDSND